MKTCMKWLNRVFLVLDTANKAALFIAAAGFSIICFIQVFCRFVLNNSIVWGDQACRYLFCVSTFLGTALCVKEKKHTSIDLLAELLPACLRKYQTIVIYLIIAAFGVVLATSGQTLAIKASRQQVTTLPMKMGMIYAMVPISALLITINAIRVVAEQIMCLVPQKEEVK